MRANEHGYAKGAASLEKEIDETRADVRATLEALEEKLSPGQLLDHIVALLRRHGGDYAESFVRAAKENPVATLLASMGLAWLMTAARPEGDEQAERKTPYAPPPGEETTRRLGETPLALPARPDTRVGRIRSGFDHLIYEQPLVMGAIGVAVGAIVGAALRSSANGGAYVEESIEEETYRAANAAEPTRSEPPGQ